MQDQPRRISIAPVAGYLHCGCAGSLDIHGPPTNQKIKFPWKARSGVVGDKSSSHFSFARQSSVNARRSVITRHSEFIIEAAILSP